MVDHLARELVRLGHAVVVLAPARGFLRMSDGVARTYPMERHPRFISTRRLVAAYGWFLRRCMRRWRPEVLHCHGVYPTGYLGAISAPKAGVPLVITDHYGPALGDRRTRGHPSIGRRRSQALAAADALIATSLANEENYRRLAGRAGRVARIPHGVDLAELAAPAPRPPDLDPAIRPGGYVLYLGRWRIQKGVDVLLKAFSLLRPEPPERLVIAGEGRDGAEFEDLARSLGLGDRVRWVGWAEGALKTYLLQNATCTVVPSRVAEAFGLVVLESFAAGRPVIATAIPGLGELVQDGETGMVVEPDSPRSLARALRTVLSDRGLAERLGAKARRFAGDYGLETMARKHVDLYQELTGGRGSRTAVPAGCAPGG